MNSLKAAANAVESAFNEVSGIVAEMKVYANENSSIADKEHQNRVRLKELVGDPQLISAMVTLEWLKRHLHLLADQNSDEDTLFAGRQRPVGQKGQRADQGQQKPGDRGEQIHGAHGEQDRQLKPVVVGERMSTDAPPPATRPVTPPGAGERNPADAPPQDPRTGTPPSTPPRTPLAPEPPKV